MYFFYYRKLTVFHHYRRYQLKATQTYTRTKFGLIHIATDQHRWAKSMRHVIVIPSIVHHRSHLIVVLQQIIRLKQCKLSCHVLKIENCSLFDESICRSMDSKCYKSSNVYMSPHTTHSTHSHDRMALSNPRKRMPGAYIKHTTPSPHEERRLQTSCSLPETPIFARGYRIHHFSNLM